MKYTTPDGQEIESGHQEAISEYDRLFDAWMLEVDIELQKLCGLKSADLGDYSYYDDFDDELTPYDCAREVLKYNDFPGD